MAESSGPQTTMHPHPRGQEIQDPNSEFNAQYTLRLQQPDFAKTSWVQKLLEPLIKMLYPHIRRLLEQFEGKGAVARRQRILGTKVLVAVLGGDPNLAAQAETDASKYKVYYGSVELRKAMDAQKFLVLLSTDQFDVVHLLGKFDKRAIFNDDTGFQLRLSDVKRACDYAQVKMLWLATENDLDVIRDNPVLLEPQFHLILTKERGENFPKFLSTLLSRLARGESVAVAWDSFVPHAQYKGDKVNCKLVQGTADIAFYP
jgi:hypothetical protein